MAYQDNESMGEGLKKLMGQISQLMLTPDADIQFLSQMQLQVRDAVMKQASAAANLSQGVAGVASAGGGGLPGGAPGGPMGGAAPMLGPAGPQPSPAGPIGAPSLGPLGGGLGGGAAGIPTPNPDELRRVLSGGR